jgi:predicted RNA-binding Zn ribbon-like protein
MVTFEFVGGDLAADLVNTGDWTVRGLENDRLSSYAELLSWAVSSGSTRADVAAALAREARQNPVAAESALAAAHRVRAVIRSVFADVAAGHEPNLDALNAELARALPQRRLAGSEWVWLDADRNLESPLWPVILSAANLLTSPDASRIRMCAKPDCGWMFVDRSRNGLRRWCQMATCGTEEKTRRRAERANRAG